MYNANPTYSLQRDALESCVKGWGVSVLVGWTDKYDFSARPIQLIAGRTWKGSLFGGETVKDAGNIRHGGRYKGILGFYLVSVCQNRTLHW